ncbi:putative ABC transport system ATP-binding protein [Pontibacter mucosus]|uniref:Putative ABC transport system ATP-binding protein n=2 Tax=Pontibacter TaxID=323449 RepID=A0A1I2WK55_9BACT|nr:MULTISPECIES: ABC transporter ATP-binding protein [Pontibacter]PTX21215.1 putative ABC transport system ATP-binding protein [Pontibacter mucosus]SFH00726.1 putative ABC transport system ATP-binding protein [Pontibacter chinhatensis]
MSTQELIIDTQNLQKKYVTDTVETTALAGVDLKIKRGEFVAIMGPSGCGKSTLLNILGMLDSPSAGSFKFLGQEVANVSERQRAKLRKQNLGFVFQSFNLIDELTVEENIALPLAYLGYSKSEMAQRTLQAMERMGIAHRRSHFPQQLSGGQQQRAAIARAVVSEPALILADEPTGNLDSVHGREVMQLLSELNDAGTTVVMVTHSPTDAEYAHRIVNLFDGQIVTENLNVRRHAAELL